MRQFYFALLLFFAFRVESKQDAFQREVRSTDLAIKSSNDEKDVKTYLTHHRPKRFIQYFVLLAMVGSLTVDVTIKVNGCKSVVKGIGKMNKNFERKRKQLDALGKAINPIHARVKALMYLVNEMSGATGDVFNQLKVLESVQTKFLVTLDPNLLKNLNETTKNLTKEVKEADKKIEDFDSINIKYDGVFSTVWKSIWRVHGFLVRPVWMLMKKTYKITQKRAAANVVNNNPSTFSKVVRDAAKGLNTAKQEAYKLKRVKKLKRWVKRHNNKLRIAKFLAKTIYGVASIGMEIYNVLQTIAECKSIYDEIKKAVAKITPEISKLQDLKSTLLSLESNLTLTFTALKSQLSGDEFATYMKEIQKIVESSTGITPEMETANANIKNFLAKFPTATRTKSVVIANNLREALKITSKVITCFNEKFQVVDRLSNYCKSGIYDLEGSYASAIKGFTPSCMITSYLNKNDLKKVASSRLTEAGYLVECRLNSLTLRALICSDKRKGLTIHQSASLRSVKETQAKYIYARCEIATVESSTKLAICNEKLALKTIKQVLESFSSYNKAEVQSTYKLCPYPVLSDNIKTMICKRKNENKPLSEIQKEFVYYSVSDVKSQYYACAIPEDEKKLICFLRKKNPKFLSSFRLRYGKLVDAVACTTEDISHIPTEDMKQTIFRHYLHASPHQKDVLKVITKQHLDELILKETEKYLEKIK